jgi:hypothetical protein
MRQQTDAPDPAKPMDVDALIDQHLDTNLKVFAQLTYVALDVSTSRKCQADGCCVH